MQNDAWSGAQWEELHSAAGRLAALKRQAKEFEIRLLPEHRPSASETEVMARREWEDRLCGGLGYWYSDTALPRSLL